MIRDQVKKWLKETKTSRKQLAELLMISNSTLDGWLLKKNPRPIPPKKRGALEAIMAPKNDDGDIELVLTFTPEQMLELKKDLPEGTDISEAMKKRLLAFIRASRIDD